MLMSHKKKLIIITVVTVLGLAVLILAIFGGEKLEMEEIKGLPTEEIPGPVHNWLNRNIEHERYGAFYGEGHLYLVVKLGQRPTGGYTVLLGDVQLGAQATVRVKEVAPKPWDFVTQVLTYPRTVSRVQCPQRPETVTFYGVANSVLAKVAVEDLHTETGGD